MPRAALLMAKSYALEIPAARCALWHPWHRQVVRQLRALQKTATGDSASHGLAGGSTGDTSMHDRHIDRRFNFGHVDGDARIDR
jgi:hypothetical protein